jgi:hypothetical protein
MSALWTAETAIALHQYRLHEEAQRYRLARRRRRARGALLLRARSWLADGALEVRSGTTEGFASRPDEGQRHRRDAPDAVLADERVVVPTPDVGVSAAFIGGGDVDGLEV